MFAGCAGYTAEPLHVRSGAKIAVPVFKNQTHWRDVEFDLTDAVSKELRSRTDYKLTQTKDADLVMTGNILGYTQPVVSEGSADQVKEGSVKAVVHIQVKDLRTGKMIIDRQLEGSAAFVLSRGESESTARAEAFEDLAENIMNLFEKRW